MLQILIHNYGSQVAVGMKSANKPEVVENYYSFYNLNCTSGEIYWIEEDGPVYFGYFWAKTLDFEKWFFKSSFRLLLNKRDIDDDDEEGIKQITLEAEKLAKFRRKNVKAESFLPSSSTNVDFSTFSVWGDSNKNKKRVANYES